MKTAIYLLLAITFFSSCEKPTIEEIEKEVQVTPKTDVIKESEITELPFRFQYFDSVPKYQELEINQYLYKDSSYIIEIDYLLLSVIHPSNGFFNIGIHNQNKPTWLCQGAEVSLIEFTPTIDSGNLIIGFWSDGTFDIDMIINSINIKIK